VTPANGLADVHGVDGAPSASLETQVPAYSLDVVLSRRWSVFCVAFAVWSWVIWPRFAAAIWADPRSWSRGAPTGFLLVHAGLIALSLAGGTAIGVMGVRGWRAAGKR
jgi:hypothetical protein